MMMSFRNIWKEFIFLRACSNVPRPLRSSKKKSTRKEVKYFVDTRAITAKGGNGGDGCISLLSLWSNENAGPDGGDGGNGGHVILQASTNKRDLNHLTTIITAENGKKGMNKDCHGASGEHVIIEVPVGTIIRNKSGEELADLYENGIMFILARGGAGGHGNHFFASDLAQTPMIAESGGIGEKISYFLEVKTIADYGLLGLPNAGKSTLLQSISRSRTKVASYPFTTIKPHVGIINYEDFTQLSVADLPGLIEGSHKNYGLGIDFLKHAERCNCLLMVLDTSEDPISDLEVLRSELEAYGSQLSKKKQIIVANKMDLDSSKKNLKLLEKQFGKDDIIPISAKYGQNMLKLLMILKRIHDTIHLT